jgi:hypothetical protein
MLLTTTPPAPSIAPVHAEAIVLRSDHPIPDVAGCGPAFGSGRSAFALRSAHASEQVLVLESESALRVQLTSSGRNSQHMQEAI